MKSISVYKFGTKVTTVIGSIDGIITSVTIRPNRTIYEISYFYDGSYRNVSLDEFEFNVDQKDKVKIGFK